MSYIGKTELKKWFAEEMKPFFKKHSFQYKSGVNVDTRQETDRCIFITWFQVDSLDTIAMYLPQIRYKQVENILYEITAKDVYKYSDTLRINRLPGLEQGKIKSRETLNTLAGTFKRVFEQEYLPAFAHYHDPYQALKLWDSLKTPLEKGKYFADSNNHCKILIISKMARDKKYQDRVQQSLAHYNTLIANGEEFFKEELANCQRVISYLEENQL
jgi:hypothetical protein